MGVCGKGRLGVNCLRGSTCVEEMGCGRELVIWLLRGTEASSGRSGVS